ncbi:MAG: hypothetical protein Kow0042_07650 [Calditrichia bacterium]
MNDLKEQVVQIIKSMPGDITLDDIMAELYFKLQVDAGLKEPDERKGIPHSQVKERMEK